VRALLALATSATLGACGSSEPAAQTPSGSPIGYIVAANLVSDPSHASTADARYRYAPDCAKDKVGDHCTYTPACAAKPTPASAGTVTLTARNTATLQASSDKTYHGMAFDDMFADPGQTVSFAASGDEVPPHTGTVAMPVSLQVSGPTFSWGMVVDRSSDLAVSWTPSDASSFDLMVLVNDVDGSDLDTIDCSFADAGGQGIVSKELLARLPAILAGQQVYVAVNRLNWTTVKAGSWTVSLGAESTLTVPVKLQ
jgi:hypothetical protein